MKTVSFFAALVHKLFPDFNYTWLAKEMIFNLPKELNFVLEGHNAER